MYQSCKKRLSLSTTLRNAADVPIKSSDSPLKIKRPDQKLWKRGGLQSRSTRNHKTPAIVAASDVKQKEANQGEGTQSNKAPAMVAASDIKQKEAIQSKNTRNSKAPVIVKASDIKQRAAIQSKGTQDDKAPSTVTASDIEQKQKEAIQAWHRKGPTPLLLRSSRVDSILIFDRRIVIGSEPESVKSAVQKWSRFRSQTIFDSECVRKGA